MFNLYFMRFSGFLFANSSLIILSRFISQLSRLWRTFRLLYMRWNLVFIVIEFQFFSFSIPIDPTCSMKLNPFQWRSLLSILNLISYTLPGPFRAVLGDSPFSCGRSFITLCFTLLI